MWYGNVIDGKKLVKQFIDEKYMRFEHLKDEKENKRLAIIYSSDQKNNDAYRKAIENRFKPYGIEIIPIEIKVVKIPYYNPYDDTISSKPKITDLEHGPDAIMISELYNKLHSLRYPMFVIQSPFITRISEFCDHTPSYSTRSGGNIYNDLYRHMSNTLKKKDIIEDIDFMIARMDIDCAISPISVARSMRKSYCGSSDVLHKPATVRAITAILRNIYGSKLSGKHVTILGRSDNISKTLAMSLLDKDCTISMFHTYSKYSVLMQSIKHSDIVVSAMGKYNVITKSDITNFNIKLYDKVLIDIGTNIDADGKLTGDFDIEVAKQFQYYTPASGGVGPITTLKLLENYANSYFEDEW